MTVTCIEFDPFENYLNVYTKNRLIPGDLIYVTGLSGRNWRGLPKYALVISTRHSNANMGKQDQEGYLMDDSDQILPRSHGGWALVLTNNGEIRTLYEEGNGNRSTELWNRALSIGSKELIEEVCWGDDDAPNLILIPRFLREVKEDAKV